MQWTREARLGEPGIQRVGEGEGVRIHRDNSIKGWPLLIIRCNTIHIHLHQLTTRQLTSLHGRMHIGNACLLHREDTKRAPCHYASREHPKGQAKPHPEGTD